ncbi:MAG: dipeptidase [Rhodospirillales bacterium]
MALPVWPRAARGAPNLDGMVIVDSHTHPGALYRGSGNSTASALSAIKQSKVTAVVFSIPSDIPVMGRQRSITRDPEPDELYTYTFDQLKQARALIESAGLPILLNAADLKAAKAAKTPGVILAIEGGDFAVSRLEAIAEAHALGVRVVQPGHYYPNNLTDLQKAQSKHGGLSSAGEDFIRELNRLGIVVDTAHMTSAAVARAAEVSSTPVILSHTLLTSRSGGRFIDPAHARLVAASGGLIGVWSLDHEQGTPSKSAYVNAFRAFADVVGVDHVGLGSDIDSTRGWFDGYGKLPDLAEGLSSAGYTDDEVAKMLGGNFLRVFETVTGA